MRKIAVVEDNPDNRLLVEAILEDYFEIVEYENGSDAINAIPSDPPSLILMDISLPGMDGKEVLKALRKFDHLKQIPIIALTAHAMAGDREILLEAGFNDYIRKPILDDTGLINSINALL